MGKRSLLPANPSATFNRTLWPDYPNPQDRPLYERRGEIAAQFGAARARWMMERIRNLLFYPNVFFMDQTSTQLRVIHRTRAAAGERHAADRQEEDHCAE
jgi:hypothetical protein